MSSWAFNAINVVLQKLVEFTSSLSLVIILGEGKSLPYSKYLYKKPNCILVSIDPIFKSFIHTKRFNKKIRDGLVPQEAEKVKIRNILLLHGKKKYRYIIFISINAHTHAGKFYDRILTSAPKIFEGVIICGINSWCHNPGLYKRQIRKKLLYPKSRRDGTFNGGCCMDISLAYTVL